MTLAEYYNSLQTEVGPIYTSSHRTVWIWLQKLCCLFDPCGLPFSSSLVFSAKLEAFYVLKPLYCPSRLNYSLHFKPFHGFKKKSLSPASPWSFLITLRTLTSLSELSFYSLKWPSKTWKERSFCLWLFRKYYLLGPARPHLTLLVLAGVWSSSKVPREPGKVHNPTPPSGVFSTSSLNLGLPLYLLLVALSLVSSLLNRVPSEPVCDHWDVLV